MIGNDKRLDIGHDSRCEGWRECSRRQDGAQMGCLTRLAGRLMLSVGMNVDGALRQESNKKDAQDEDQ